MEKIIYEKVELRSEVEIGILIKILEKIDKYSLSTKILILFIYVTSIIMKYMYLILKELRLIENNAPVINITITKGVLK